MINSVRSMKDDREILGIRHRKKIFSKKITPL